MKNWFFYLPLLLIGIMISIVFSHLCLSSSNEVLKVGYYFKTNICYMMLTLLLVLQVMFGNSNDK